MYGVACPPSFRASTGLRSPIDRSQEIEFFPPGFYVLHSRLAPTGDTGHGFHGNVVYGITPETARSSCSKRRSLRNPMRRRKSRSVSIAADCSAGA
jgi:hypothetical protein